MKYNKNTNLRLYAFCNFYMNSISQGIQTAHVVGRMAKLYRQHNGDAANFFWDWLEEGNETIIVLNGGMGADISEAYYKHASPLDAAGIPSEIFYEELRAFGTSEPAPTCWACVLPEEVYATKSFIDLMGNNQYYNGDVSPLRYDISHQLYGFLEYKNSCGLAR